MDIPSSALTTGLRIGVQIVTSQKRPIVEIYHHLRNVMSPEHDYGPDQAGRAVKHRLQETFVTFTAVNIGGVRAENVSFSIDTKLVRWPPDRGFGEIFATTLPVVSPGQAIMLFRMDAHEFDLHSEPDASGAAKRVGVTYEPIAINVSYDGPWEGLNRLYRLWSKLRKQSQFTIRHVWLPQTIYGDLPAVEYA